MESKDILTIQSSLTNFKEVEFIRKEALLEELDRLLSELINEGENTMFEQGRISALEDVKLFINESIE